MCCSARGLTKSAAAELSRAFESRTSGMVLIAVIFAGLASLGLVGNYSYFGHSSSMLLVTIDWIAVLVCGLIGGLLGALFAFVVVRGTARRTKSRCFLSVTVNSVLSSSTDSDEPRKSTPRKLSAKWKISSARVCASWLR